MIFGLRDRIWVGSRLSLKVKRSEREDQFNDCEIDCKNVIVGKMIYEDAVENDLIFPDRFFTLKQDFGEHAAFLIDPLFSDSIQVFERYGTNSSRGMKLA